MNIIEKYMKLLIVQARATWSRHGRSVYRRGTRFAIAREITRMCDLF